MPETTRGTQMKFGASSNTCGSSIFNRGEATVSKQLYTEKLAQSGLTPADAKKLGFKYLKPEEAHRMTKDHRQPFKEPSFLIPYFEPDGKPNCFWRMRRLTTPDKSGQFRAQSTKKAKDQRYTQLPHVVPRAYFPPLLDTPWGTIVNEPGIPIFITEGELKAASGCKFVREPFIALGGVWNWTSKKHKTPLIPDLEAISWVGRMVYIVFDADAATNPNVKKALSAFSRTLAAKGALVHVIDLPPLHDDTGEELKTGLDDFLMTDDGPTRFEHLIQVAQPYSLARALWDLNDRVVWIRHPTMVVEQGTDELMSVQQFKDNFAPHKYYRENAKGDLVEVSAPKAWIEWQHRNEVDRVVFRPGEEKFVDDPRTGRVLYNTWTGWAIEPEPGDISPWVELLDYVFQGEPKHRQWFERWCAFQFQNPGVKMYTAIIVWGRMHGTGKSLIGVTLNKIFGKNGTVIDNKQLASNYNKWAENKQFILGDEITGVEKRKEADYIKTLITRPSFEVNAKYMPTYEMEDISNWYLTSNHCDAFIIEDEDRRFFVWHFPEKPLPLEFYRRYDAWMHGDGPKHLFHHLLGVNLGDFNPKAPAPVTQDKQEMIYQSKSDAGVWAYELKSNPDHVLRLDNMALKCDLYTTRQLVMIAEAAGVRVFNENALARELTNAGFPPSRPIKTGSGTQRLRPVRGVDRWLAESPVAWSEHWDKYYGRKKKKF